MLAILGFAHVFSHVSLLRKSPGYTTIFLDFRRLLRPGQNFQGSACSFVGETYLFVRPDHAHIDQNLFVSEQIRTQLSVR